jgi:ATP-dependent Clp protease protease subunit
MASVLLCAGAKGRRLALPNARVLIHQPLGGVRGQATDIEIHAKEILRLRQRLTDIYIQHTNQTEERLRRDLERDFIMEASEAKAYGLVDDVVQTRKPEKK